MPKFITKLGIPEPYFSALKMFIREPRTQAISATELLQPPRVLALKNRHWDDKDASGNPTFVINVDHLLAAFKGSACHAFIQTHHAQTEGKQGPSNFLLEETLRMAWRGWEITGTPDLVTEVPVRELPDEARLLLPDNFDKEKATIIRDWKWMKAFRLIFGGDGLISDLRDQLDIYAHELRYQGFEPDLGHNGITVDDWSEFRAVRESNYPKKRYLNVWHKLRTREDSARFFEDRVKMHQDAERAGVADEDLEPCTEEERWVKSHEWAVMKGTNKGASRVFKQEKGESEADAAAWIASKANPSEYRVDFRAGESTRCQPQWCTSYQACKMGQGYRPPQEGQE